ncbi:MAG: hypothetical protein IJ264_03580, partial [Clostridia bacterium]|nr:hypothetical protein [Clostridia bacterium]
MKKTFKKLMAVILAVMVMLGCSAMAFAGGDGMEVEESIPSAIDSMYNSGEDFIYIFTSPDCANSAAVMKYYVNWVRIVDVALYEVSTEDGYPSTMCADIGNSVTLPVVVFVKDGKAEYY